MKINLNDYNQLGKHHKPLKDLTDDNGRQIFQIAKGNDRLRYVVDRGVRKIIETFKKGNHKTTDQARNKL